MQNSIPILSEAYFIVVVRATFVDCLGPFGRDLVIREGEHIETHCTYYGRPLPSLRCELKGANAKVLMALDPPLVYINYTQKNPIIFPDVKRTAKEVVCTATHRTSGTSVVRRNVMVYSKYHRMFLFNFNLLIFKHIAR